MITLTDEHIDAIAEAMPGGIEGFLKGWGWRQFARSVLMYAQLNKAKPTTLHGSRDKSREGWLESAVDHDFLGKPITHMMLIQVGPAPGLIQAWAESGFNAGYEAAMLDYALALQLREAARGTITMEEELTEERAT